MKKLICTLLAVLCLCSFFACGSHDNSTASESTQADMDINLIKDQIISELNIEDAMELAPERLLALYGVESEDISDSACFVTMGGVFPDEIVMIKATDADAADRIEGKLNTRLDEIKVQSQSYDPANYAIAQECKVLRKGNVVALFMSANHVQMEEIFNG